MLDLLITNALVCNADQDPYLADIAVDDGTIVGVSQPQDPRPDAERVVDAAGKVVMPGFLDAHVHPGVYRELEEDLESLSRFAAMGGITSFVAFSRPDESYLTSVPRIIDSFSRSSYLDFSFIFGITQMEQIEEIATVRERFGVRAFKFYLGYCGHEGRFHADFPFDDKGLVSVLETMSQLPDTMLAVHCENPRISEYYQDRERQGGREHDLAFYNTIHPVVSELDAAVHATLLGHHYGVRICVVHVSAGTTARTLRSLPWVTDESVVLETCPHYLFFDDQDPAGTRGVVKPPVRDRQEADLLWRYVEDGTLDILGSDNCANVLDDKVGVDLYTTSRVGMGEMGLTLPLMLSEGHHRRGLPLRRIVEMGSTNIARAHHLYPRKGVIRPGADADLVIVDLDEERTVDPAALKGNADGSIYAGRVLRGWPVVTVAGGRVLVEDGSFSGELGRARFLGTPPAGSAPVVG